ncbi:MAG: hypothetical protein RL346_896 [Verrucomicrobiota bacterium]
MLMKQFVRLITLVALASSIASAEQEMKMRSLFNGKDLTGWKGEGYVVEDGAITCTPKGRNLMTAETFSNYSLEFEFLLTPGANNGLGIHYPGVGDGAYTGMEIQVLDNSAEKYKNLKEYQFHGSIYTLAPAKKTGLKPVGEWNHQQVMVNGSQVRVVLNGETILNVNLNELSKKDPKHEGVKRRAGHIAWLGHGDKVSYRNIRIMELPPEREKLPQGFVSIFDGESLSGWKHEKEIANWTVSGKILKHNGKAGPTTHLWTEASYKDFTMVFDWRWSGRGEMKMQPVVLPDGTHKGKTEIEELDSGILMRGDMKSQVNLWNWTVGSGEVYGYRMDKNMPAEVKAAVTPKLKADNPLGEWNRMEITLKGDRLSVILNGKQVIENAQLPDVPKEGPIGLQHHGQAIDFANIFIKEL